MQPASAHIWTKWRGDLSALLLIAFIFQFLTPIIVLANPISDGQSAFEQSPRASICRVYIDDPADTHQQSQTDTFVCEFCILCSADVTDRYDLLPEVVLYKLPTGPTQPIEMTDQAPQRLPLSLRPSVPRAPPLAL